MKKYEITKEEIIEIDNSNLAEIHLKLKNWFPDAFKTELETGKWYKHPVGDLFYCTEIYEGVLYGYGFFYGSWKNITDKHTNRCACNDIAKSELVLATTEEVQTALINEAKKRGYKYGVCVKCNSTNEAKSLSSGDFYYSENLYYKGANIFKNGKWAEILPTITKSEAEKILNKKIID